MSVRKRSPRNLRVRHRKRTLLPLLENLEDKLLLSELVSHSAEPAPKPVAHLPYVVEKDPAAAADNKFSPLAASGIYGYSPQQFQGAYGVNQISFNGIQGTGAGQTIALIEGGNYPGLYSALQTYDATWGIPDPPSFAEYNQNGGTNLPAPISGWGLEITLDVELSHAMAPDANIIVVEASSSSLSSSSAPLLQAASTAGGLLGASVVSMSWGYFLETSGDSFLEPQLDSTYFAPALAANPDVTFLAATGDNGSYPGPSYPADSPDVVGVGGTTLTVAGSSGSYSWGGETAWSGSGGGISNIYSEPSWQEPVQSYGMRTVPDVSADANPSTGAAVYDPDDYGGWVEVGGTSLSTPLWAGMIAVADQGRSVLGNSPLDGPNQTLPALYGDQNYTTNYHDITQGNTGLYSAGPGYDLATGIGTPIASHLMPALAAYGEATQIGITTQPPSSVVAGGVFGLIAAVEDPFGDPATGYNGSATLTLPADPSFTPVTAPITDGTAIFDGLTLPQSDNGDQLVVSTDLPMAGAVEATTNPIAVTAPTPGVGNFYPLPTDASLRGDINVANTNADAINNIWLVYDTNYSLDNGELIVDYGNPSVPRKTLNEIGVDEQVDADFIGPKISPPRPSIGSDPPSRLYEVIGTPATLSFDIRNINFSGDMPPTMLDSAWARRQAEHS